MNMLPCVKTPIGLQIPKSKSFYFSQRPCSIKTMQQLDVHCDFLLSVIFKK